MAGKKPAKPMAGQGRSVTQDPAVYGSPVRYIGSKQAPFTCGECGKQTIRGMIRVKDSGSYCTITCAQKN